jgi:hypothetical protein
VKKRTDITILVAVGVVALGAAFVVFKPWLLFVDVRVDEALPSLAPRPAVSAEPSAPDTPAPERVPVELTSGQFISHEHETSGIARIIENPDGSVVLTLENLSTSNGPDVHVWLSGADVVEGRDGWFVAGGAPFVDLGPIKGNQGNQVYEIPAGTDISAYPSVSLWCVQFGVSFGAAQFAV